MTVSVTANVTPPKMSEEPAARVPSPSNDATVLMEEAVASELVVKPADPSPSGPMDVESNADDTGLAERHESPTQPSSLNGQNSREKHVKVHIKPLSLSCLLLSA